MSGSYHNECYNGGNETALHRCLNRLQEDTKQFDFAENYSVNSDWDNCVSDKTETYDEIPWSWENEPTQDVNWRYLRGDTNYLRGDTNYYPHNSNAGNHCFYKKAGRNCCHACTAYPEDSFNFATPPSHHEYSSSPNYFYFSNSSDDFVRSEVESNENIVQAEKINSKLDVEPILESNRNICSSNTMTKETLAIINPKTCNDDKQIKFADENFQTTNTGYYEIVSAAKEEKTTSTHSTHQLTIKKSIDLKITRTEPQNFGYFETKRKSSTGIGNKKEDRMKQVSFVELGKVTMKVCKSMNKSQSENSRPKETNLLDLPVKQSISDGSVNLHDLFTRRGFSDYHNRNGSKLGKEKFEKEYRKYLNSVLRTLENRVSKKIKHTVLKYASRQTEKNEKKQKFKKIDGADATLNFDNQKVAKNNFQALIDKKLDLKVHWADQEALQTHIPISLEYKMKKTQEKSKPASKIPVTQKKDYCFKGKDNACSLRKEENIYKEKQENCSLKPKENNYNLNIKENMLDVINNKQPIIEKILSLGDSLRENFKKNDIIIIERAEFKNVQDKPPGKTVDNSSNTSEKRYRNRRVQANKVPREKISAHTKGINCICSPSDERKYNGLKDPFANCINKDTCKSIRNDVCIQVGRRKTKEIPLACIPSKSLVFFRRGCVQNKPKIKTCGMQCSDYDCRNPLYSPNTSVILSPPNKPSTRNKSISATKIESSEKLSTIPEITEQELPVLPTKNVPQSIHSLEPINTKPSSRELKESVSKSIPSLEPLNINSSSKELDQFKNDTVSDVCPNRSSATFQEIAENTVEKSNSIPSLVPLNGKSCSKNFSQKDLIKSPYGSLEFEIQDREVDCPKSKHYRGKYILEDKLREYQAKVPLYNDQRKLWKQQCRQYEKVQLGKIINLAVFFILFIVLYRFLEQYITNNSGFPFC